MSIYEPKLYILGCNSGGGGGNFSKVKRLVPKRIGTRKQLISCFFQARVGFYKHMNFSPWHILSINPHIHICPCSCALLICKNIGIRTYFSTVTVESVWGFRHFALWRHGFRLATFFIAPKNCIF